MFSEKENVSVEQRKLKICGSAFMSRKKFSEGKMFRSRKKAQNLLKNWYHLLLRKEFSDYFLRRRPEKTFSAGRTTFLIANLPPAICNLDDRMIIPKTNFALTQ